MRKVLRLLDFRIRFGGEEFGWRGWGCCSLGFIFKLFFMVYL